MGSHFVVFSNLCARLDMRGCVLGGVCGIVVTGWGHSVVAPRMRGKRRENSRVNREINGTDAVKGFRNKD